MESVIWVQILDDTVCVSICANALEKAMNPSVFPPAMGK